MIPTALLLGLAIGRTWSVPAIAGAWAVLLIAAGTISGADIPTAAALGAANVAVGVLVHRMVTRLVRRAPTLR